MYEFLAWAEREHFTPAEIKQCYEGKLNGPRLDPIMKQLYLLVLGISEIEYLFENTEFERDTDLSLWLSLKTCHVAAVIDHIE